MPASENPIVRGATVTELALMFGMDRRDIMRRISGVPSIGIRGNASPIWHVKDVAPKLVKFEEDDTEVLSRVMQMHHQDLPKMMTKEFWYGQNQRLNYLERLGLLWDTAAVVELAADVFKTFRLSMTLATDTVEREVRLTPRTREIIQSIIEGALNDVREKLVDSLNGSRARSKGKTFAPQAAIGADPYAGVGPASEWSDDDRPL